MALSLSQQQPDLYFYINQYGNAYGKPIIKPLPKKYIAKPVAGLGSTGTLAGIGKRLQELNPSIRLVILQPDVYTYLLEGRK